MKFKIIAHRIKRTSNVRDSAGIKSEMSFKVKLFLDWRTGFCEPEMTSEKESINRSSWLILGMLSCLGLIAMYAETMVLPAIPAFIRDFDMPYSTSSWILSSYMIAGAVATPIAGKLSDTYGRKKILLAVLSVYSAGILAGGFANSLPFMLA